MEKLDFQKTISYKKGVEQFNNGEIPNIKTPKIFWVKKLIGVRDWNGFYKYNSAYCFLRKEAGKGVWVGFVVANKVPKDCELLNTDELLAVDDYRKAHKIYPTPCEVVK